MPLRNLPVPLRRSLAWIVGMSAGHGRLSTAALLRAVSRPMTPTEDSQNKAGMFFRISASSLRVLLEDPVSQAQVGGPSRSRAAGLQAAGETPEGARSDRESGGRLPDLPPGSNRAGRPGDG